MGKIILRTMIIIMIVMIIIICGQISLAHLVFSLLFIIFLEHFLFVLSVFLYEICGNHNFNNIMVTEKELEVHRQDKDESRQGEVIDKQ